MKPDFTDWCKGCIRWHQLFELILIDVLLGRTFCNHTFAYANVENLVREPCVAFSNHQ